MPDNFIHKLTERLKEDLPGACAQNKMSPSVRFTGKVIPNTNKTRESSVLILFYLKDNTLYIPFIQRSRYDGPHSGQISLPGGKFEPQDKNLLETALRETWEEIGVRPDKMQILGNLTSTYIPNSNYNVTPYIAYLPEEPNFILDSFEVANIIEAQVAQLIAPETIDLFVKKVNGVQVEAPFFNINNHQIWGATAMIISELKELITTIDTIPSNSCNAHNGQESR
ncbi:NUDIX hydrolase [Saccharicrinis sp. 156]|uniref:NUDIX hydrolase n=1 Tax=Saccharicrinis sp. 156 TaxID=3417574 RepID=UPI003D327DF8